jgi:hypothetical protein
LVRLGDRDLKRDHLYCVRLKVAPSGRPLSFEYTGISNPLVESEIAAWFDATSFDEEKAAVRRLNKAALEHVVYAPLGCLVAHTSAALLERQKSRVNCKRVFGSSISHLWYDNSMSEKGRLRQIGVFASRPGSPGEFNWSAQHFVLEGKDGVRNGTKIS